MSFINDFFTLIVTHNYNVNAIKGNTPYCLELKKKMGETFAILTTHLQQHPGAAFGNDIQAFMQNVEELGWGAEIFNYDSELTDMYEALKGTISIARDRFQHTQDSNSSSLTSDQSNQSQAEQTKYKQQTSSSGIIRRVRAEKTNASNFNQIIDIFREIIPEEDFLKIIKTYPLIKAYHEIYTKIIGFVFSGSYLTLNQLSAICKIFLLIEGEAFPEGEEFIKEDKEEAIFNVVYDLFSCVCDMGDVGPKNPRLHYIDILEEEVTTNDTFLLKECDNKTKKWVFKPMRPQGGDTATTIPIKYRPKRELMSHLVNFHGRFPVPLQLLLQVQGKKYSVHRYVEGVQGCTSMEKSQDLSKEEEGEFVESGSSESETNYKPIDKKSFHCLLVFDLIFSNGDRHDNNIIFVKPEPRKAVKSDDNQASDTEYQTVGIDHEDCMIDKEGNAIKITYLNLPPFSVALEESVYDLVSEAYEKEYVRIMQTDGFEIPESAIEWMRFSCKCIRYIKNKNSNAISAKLIAKILIYIHDNTHFDIDFDCFKHIINIIIEYRKPGGKKTIEEIIKALEIENEAANFLKDIFTHDSFKNIFSFEN